MSEKLGTIHLYLVYSTGFLIGAFEAPEWAGFFKNGLSA
jgi:hypothetical protein